MSDTDCRQDLPTGLLIDGEWTNAADGKTVAVIDPATGEAADQHRRRRAGRRDGGARRRLGRGSGLGGDPAPRSGPRSSARRSTR